MYTMLADHDKHAYLKKIVVLVLSPWAMWLYRKMTKKHREKLTKRLVRKGQALVRCYVDKRGRTRVSTA